MAIMQCSECGKEVSDTAKRCVHCGAKIKKSKEYKFKTINKNKIGKKAKIIILLLSSFCLVIISIFAPLFFVASSTRVHTFSFAKADESFVKLYRHLEQQKLPKSIMKVENNDIVFLESAYKHAGSTLSFSFSNGSYLSRRNATFFIREESIEIDSGNYRFELVNDKLITVYVFEKDLTKEELETKLIDAQVFVAICLVAMDDYLVTNNIHNGSFKQVLKDFHHYALKVDKIRIASLVVFISFTVIFILLITLTGLLYRNNKKNRYNNKEINNDLIINE